MHPEAWMPVGAGAASRLRRRDPLWRFAALVATAVAALIGSVAPASAADPTLAATYVTNSGVNAVALSNNTLYLGGAFTSVGPRTGGFAGLDSSSGSLDSAFPDVTGQVRAVASDGSGGWYIGGIFTYVDGVARNNVAHINPDKTLDLGWNPNADGAVRALAVSGTTVYAGGDFTNVGGASRNRIAALDATTGDATAWNPDADNSVASLAVSGSTVYVGGNFTSIGGQSRNNIAALDSNTNANNATAWNPNANSFVNTVAISGSTVYAGGGFTSIGGQSRNRIAALDANANTNNASSWNPNADNSINALAVSGSTVYVGGNFTSIGGQSRNRIAALDANTNNATAWNPNADGAVFALAVSGSTVAAGGLFTSVGGVSRNRIAAIDLTTGQVTPWNPNADNTVRALAVSGSTVYAGGQFSSIGGQTRNNIAALDANTDTNNATAWDPNANSWVRALSVSGSTIYAGGDFSSIGGQSRNGIAALDANTNTNNATAWDPNADFSVHALAVSGSTVYAGGEFTSIGGQSRNRIAALDANTNTNNATAWNPNADGEVTALAVSGSTVYVGGNGLGSIGGQSRSNIAALDANTNTNNATAWNPSANNQVAALAVSGSTVYAGGNFTTIGGQNRNFIAALDADTNTNNATEWNPDANNAVNALAVADSVYAGGDFSSIVNRPQARIAVLSPFAKASPALSTSASNANLGSAISDAATLSGGSEPTGQITFRAYGPDDLDCSGPAGFTASVNVDSGDGTYASGDFTPTAAGAYRWTADYSGDANNEAASSPCNDAGEISTVSKAMPTLQTTASAGVKIGAKVHDTATLAGGQSPTGQITFRLYGPGDTNCSKAPRSTTTRTVFGNGAYRSADVTPTELGTYRWTASYSGDARNAPRAGACNAANETVTVSKATPTLRTTASAGVKIGAKVHDTATLAGGQSPTGQITFRLYGPGDTNCSKAPRSTTTRTVFGNGAYRSADFAPRAIGRYRWRASYSGDARNVAVVAACNAPNESVTVTAG